MKEAMVLCAFTLHGVLMFAISSILIYTPCKGGCIQPSCVKRNFTVACILCNQNGATFLGYQPLISDPNKQNISKTLSTAVTKLVSVWINEKEENCTQNDDEPCQVFQSTPLGLVLVNKSCSDDYDFFCYHVKAEDAKCKSCLIQRSNMSVSQIIVITATVLGLMVIGFICFVYKRQVTPVRYAVRKASALYRRQHTEVATETGNGSQQTPPDDSESRKYYPNSGLCEMNNALPETGHVN